ncbi:MAG TPA: acyl-CoA dehydrogenase family protein [Spirochaetota bacterium]|nr:acyl-CoA dehydrogenase family protein [Spirochaetota bacterium]
MSNLKYNPIIHNLDEIASLSPRVINPGINSDETETVDMLVETIRRYAAAHIKPLEIDHDSTIPEIVLKKAAELGLFGLTVNSTYGGAGLSLKATCRAIEELAFFDSSTATTIGLHAGLGLRGLNYLAPVQLQKAYLPQLARGDVLAAFAATEPEAGSHIANIKTKAIGSDARRELVINGSKIYVTNGSLAGVFTILAATPDLAGNKKGHSVILVPRDTPGLTVGEKEHKLGMRGSSTTSLFFDNVTVSYDNIIGTPGLGMEHLADILIWGRILMSAGCLGSARYAFSRACEYATVRNQFNAPIGTFGMIQSKIASMRKSIYTMEALIRSTTQNFEEGKDITFESTVTKVACSEGVWNIADEALQIHGGSGFIEETGIARVLRDSRITRIFEGTNEVLRYHTALQAFSWNRDDLMKAGFGPGLHESLSARDGELLSAKADFDEILSHIKKTYGFSVMRNQFVLYMLANAAISLNSMISVLIYTNGILLSPASESVKTYCMKLCASIIADHAGAISFIRQKMQSGKPLNLHDETIANYEYERVLGKPLAM